MAVDFKMMGVVATIFPNAEQHDKHNFDKDYNRFVVKQDELSAFADKAYNEGNFDEFVSYVNNNINVDVRKAIDDKARLSVAIENAYLAESLDPNKGFSDIAHAVYAKFEGKITPAEFVGSAQYVKLFSGDDLVSVLSDKISEQDIEDGYLLDTDELDEDDAPDDIYDISDAYYLGDYESGAYSREAHIDLSKYAKVLDEFVSDSDCREYVAPVMKSRLQSVLDYDFEHEVAQAGSCVYFNRSLKGGNLEDLKDSVNYFMNNKQLFDKVAGTHVVDEVMRDKLIEVADVVSALSCNSILKNKERADVVCGVALEQFYRDRVGRFAGTRVIQSFVDNDKIKEPGKSKFYGDLREYLSYQMREKTDGNFGVHVLEDAKCVDFDKLVASGESLHVSRADAYVTYKSISKDIQSTIFNGFKNGLSFSDICDSLESHDDKRMNMLFNVSVGQGYMDDKELCFKEAMDNRPLIELYNNAVDVCKQKGIKGSVRTSYVNKSLDASIAYKSYMCGELTSSMMHSKDMMINLAKDVNLLSSEYNVSFDKKHLVDLVSAFNRFDSDVRDFSENLDIQEKIEPKRKRLNVPLEVQSDKVLTDDDDFEC